MIHDQLSHALGALRKKLFIRFVVVPFTLSTVMNLNAFWTTT